MDVALNVLTGNFNMWARLTKDLYASSMLHFYNAITQTKCYPIQFQIRSSMANYLVYIIHGGLDVLPSDSSKSLVQYWIS